MRRSVLDALAAEASKAKGRRYWIQVSEVTGWDIWRRGAGWTKSRVGTHMDDSEARAFFKGLIEGATPRS